MNQFHSSKNISYSGYCRVRSEGGSLILLGRKIPDVSYIAAKLTTLGTYTWQRLCYTSGEARKTVFIKSRRNSKIGREMFTLLVCLADQKSYRAYVCSHLAVRTLGSQDLLRFYNTIFHRKGTPFVYLLLTNGIPFTYLV